MIAFSETVQNYGYKIQFVIKFNNKNDNNNNNLCVQVLTGCETETLVYGGGQDQL